jgi:hypothetical protein
MESFIADLSYLSSDILSGKSLPLLVAVSTFPLDPNLMGTMIFLGVTLGGILTYAQAQLAFYRRWIYLGRIIRVINQLFSSVITVMFLYRVLPSMHPQGLFLGMIPTMVVLTQALPERPSTAFVLLILSMISFSTSVAHEIDYIEHTPVAHVEQAQLMMAQTQPHTVSRSMLALSEPHRSLLALSRKDVSIMRHRHEYKTTPIHHSASYSIGICVLSIYASIQHGDVSPGLYVSLTYSTSMLYAIMVTSTATLLRGYVYLRVGWVHQSPLHLLFSRDMTYYTPQICGFTQATVMLFSAAWSVSQITPSRFSQDARTRVVVLIMAFGYWYEWASDTYVLGAAFAMTGINAACWALAKLTAV